MSKSRGFAPSKAKCRKCGNIFIANFRRQVFCSSKCNLLSRSAPDENGCWLWQGALRDGYGAFGLTDIDARAHRASYKLFKGPIPAGKIVCHSCNVRRCVNPEHLYAGSDQTNANDRACAGTAVTPSLSGPEHPAYKHGLYVGKNEVGFVWPTRAQLGRSK